MDVKSLYHLIRPEKSCLNDLNWKNHVLTWFDFCVEYLQRQGALAHFAVSFEFNLKTTLVITF